MHASAAAAPPAFDRAAEDVGNIVEFGHLNLRVPDQLQSILFYVSGLGLTRDPFMQTGVDNAWINVGSSQFHLPVGPAQRLRGRTLLVMPDLDALQARLVAVAPRLQGSAFAVERVGGQVMDLRCPWGNRIRVQAPDAARFGPMVLGMPAIEVDCAPGQAARIARFYVELLGARVAVGEDDGGAFARVTAGPDGSLVFRETARALPPYDGHHVQLTLADFSGVHRRLVERGLVSEESNASQYRFEQIVDPDSGELLTRLEHELRSMRHPQFGRVLVNRPG